MHTMSSFFIVQCIVFEIIFPKAQSRYFSYFNEPKSWLEANDTCGICGGKLVNWDETVFETVTNNDIQSKMFWIGNYTRQFPWVRQKGCAWKSDLEYKIINNNSPVFCSRTCSEDQYFAIEGVMCYCINIEDLANFQLCQDAHNNDCQHRCREDYVTVLTIDYVWTCYFEETPCMNVSYGRERGIVWRRRNNLSDRSGNAKGYLLLQAITEKAEYKARFSINLNLEKMYYCLSFKYYMSYAGSIEIYVSNETGEKYAAWKKYGNKGNMWYSSVVDIKGHRSLTIDIYGSIENARFASDVNKIAIDDIKLKPLACIKEILLSCAFLSDICNFMVQEGLLVFLKKYKGMNSLIINASEAKMRKIYTIKTPLIKVTSLGVFCLKFYCFTYNNHRGSLKVFIETKGKKTALWTNFLYDSNFWQHLSLPIEEMDDYVIIIEYKKQSVYDKDIKIANWMLKSGICDDVTDQSSSVKEHMCPVMHFGDNSRITVGECNKMKTQSYICEYEDDLDSKLARCSSASLLNSSVAVSVTTENTLPTSTQNDKNVISSGFPTLLTSPSTANITKQHSVLQQVETRIEFVVASGILLAVVVTLLVLLALLILRLKRIQAGNNEKETLSHTPNRGYEMTAVDHGHSRLQTPDSTDYDLASPVNSQLRHQTAKIIRSNECLENVHDNDYQSCDNLTGKHKHESQVYQEMQEGDYDHLGESARRRKDFEFEGDTLYDHGQNQKLQINGLYDSTKNETDNNYFVLESGSIASSESHIYDHAK